MPRPLTGNGRRAAGLVVVAGALATLGLGLLFHGARSGSAFDEAVRSTVHSWLPSGLLRLLLTPSEPVVLLVVVVLGAAICVLRRRFSAALLLATGPVVAVALNSFVLKPVFARRYEGYLAYPSGHTVSLVAVLTVLVLLSSPGLRRLLLCATALVVTAGAGAALVGLGYHYATDVLGGIAFALTVIPGVTLLLDLPARHGPARRAGTPPAGTSSGTHPRASPR